MSKPEDIPQDAWDAAFNAMPLLLIRNYDRSPIVLVLHVNIARAILAAKAEEREACATDAEERHRIWGTHAQIKGIEVEDDISACREIAAAIRKRGEG